jgi:hypothetical protein
VTDGAAVIVSFGPSGEVAEATYMTWAREEQSPLDNLLWRAKRQWRRWFPE